ncbi:MAG: hypothetical protein J5685_02450, partial [Clostridiales bacterium]|nr:hypothetical protein [Clostridiales bacterium]
PSMALLLAEGYQYTKNKKAYAVRLGIFALISWVPYSLYETGKFPYMNLGMILTLFIAFMTILMWDKLKAPKAVKIILVIVSCFLSLFGDWSIFAVLWALFAYIYRDRPRAKWTSFAIVAAVEVLIANLIDILNERPFANLHQTGIILVPILLTVFYNRKKGSGAKIHKWFFYVYYPLHLLIFYLIKLYIYKG